jgi:hypothetical protein
MYNNTNLDHRKQWLADNLVELMANADAAGKVLVADAMAFMRAEHNEQLSERALQRQRHDEDVNTYYRELRSGIHEESGLPYFGPM